MDTDDAVARQMPWLAVAALAGVFVVGIAIVVVVVMSGRKRKADGD